jgi:hypothetical protein
MINANNKILNDLSSKNVPDFIVIGAMKSGTTTLHNILRQHSQIFLPAEKEIHYFDNDKNYVKGIDYYISFFRNAKRKQIIGEITPRYLWDHQVAQRIAKDIGTGIKLIVILRNPADRAYSHYRMNVLNKSENRPFNDVIQKEINNSINDLRHNDNIGYISRGYYAKQLKRYLRWFPKDKLHIILFEDEFINQREKTINELIRFLNLTPERLIINIKSHASVEPTLSKLYEVINTSNWLLKIVKLIIPSIKLRVLIKSKLNKFNSQNSKKLDTTNKEIEINRIKRELIKDVFYEDIKELEQIFERDLSSWYKDFI